MREYLIIYTLEGKRHSVVIRARNQYKAMSRFKDRYGEKADIEMMAMKLLRFEVEDK